MLTTYRLVMIRDRGVGRPLRVRFKRVDSRSWEGLEFRVQALHDKILAIKTVLTKCWKKGMIPATRSDCFLARFDCFHPPRFPVRNLSSTSDNLYALFPSVHNPQSATSLRTSCLQVVISFISFKSNTLTDFCAAYHSYDYDYWLLFLKDL